ncbi:MAG: hypothetical protein ACOCUI_01580 [bacterium]
MVKNIKIIIVLIIFTNLLFSFTGCSFRSKPVGILGGVDGPEEIYFESDDSTAKSEIE